MDLCGDEMKDFNLSRSEVEHLIDEWVFSDRYRHILKLRFLDGLTYEEIAEVVGMSDRQIKRIVQRQGDKVLLKMSL